MANSTDTSLDILIRTIADATGVELTDEKFKELKETVQKASNEMGVITLNAKDVDDILKKTSTTAGETADKTKELGEEVEKGGKSAVSSRLQHQALHGVFHELNKVVPGLGSALGMLMRQMHATGHAAHEASVATKEAAVGAEAVGTASAAAVPGVVAFGASLEAALAPLLPFIAIMLAVEEGVQLWDSYKEHAKEAAEANAEACKKIQESTREAKKAVDELQEAMHPKEKNTAEKDEDYLKQQLENMELVAKRQRDLNKANEEKELAGAGSQEEKQKIREKYALLDKQLEDWRAKQEAAIEGAVAHGMENQLKKLAEEEEKTRKKMGTDYQEGLRNGDWSFYNRDKAELEKNAKEASEIREKLDPLNEKARSDSHKAEYESETNRQAFATRGVRYNKPGVDDRAPGPDFEQRKAIDNALPGVIGAERSHFQGGHAFSQAQAQEIAHMKKLLDDAHLNSTQILGLIVDGTKKNDDLKKIIADVQARLNNHGL